MYKRRILTSEENSKNIVWNLESTYETTILREPSLVDDFYHEKCCNPDGSESVSIIDPIHFLFNQQRLDKLGSAALQHYLDELQSKSDSLAELRRKCSDEDLISMLKSRHLQSPSEILAWCRYMESNIEQFNEEMKSLVAQQTLSEQSTNIDNSNTE